MPIHILPTEVASKIAAGEVVEAPVSVVRELMDNSLDAGATQINVEILGGGVSMIRVSVNGTGIPSDQVDLVFKRHATSKITSLEDLEKTTSLGFRGEAMASIAAVAQVELLSCAIGKTAGTFVSYRDGVAADRGSKASPQGTTVTVKNLFHYVPARLKFLKSPTTENSHVADLMTHYGLAFPEVRLSLTLEGRKAVQFSGSGNLRNALIDSYGLDVGQTMIEVKSPIVSGYISSPSVVRSTRGHISLFVNRRWITSRVLARAVEKAYEGLIMVGRYPIAVINILLPPNEIDVNVHPAKREVRFHQEQVLFSAVHKAVHEALGQCMAPPEVKPQLLFAGSEPQRKPTQLHWSPPPATEIPCPFLPEAKSSTATVPILRVLGQMASAYVIAEGPEGLFLIDQHAAHERILFDKAMSQRTEHKVESQALLEPLTIELNPKQKQVITTRGEVLGQFGFTLEPFGDQTYMIRSVPALLGTKNVCEAIREALDSLEEDCPLEKREERIAISLACHGAIRAGQIMSQEEMRELVRQLEETSSPRTCPHGRPTMIHLSMMQLAKEFGRT